MSEMGNFFKQFFCLVSEFGVTEKFWNKIFTINEVFLTLFGQI